MSSARVLSAVAGLSMVATPALSQATTYDMVINQAASGFSATSDLSFDTAGTLRGDWDAVNNPTGTRTALGFSFSWPGPTQNENVPVTLGGAVSGPIDTATSGGFDLTIDEVLGTVAIASLSADLLAGGTASLPVTISLAPQTFRTGNPNFLYPGVPISLPIGELNVTALAITQVDAGLPGTLTPTGPGTFDFTAAPIVVIEGEADFLGTIVPIPGVPAPLLLAGQITVIGGVATLTSVQVIEQGQTTPVGTALPELPFELPTLTAGVTAGVIMSLTVEDITTEAQQIEALVASGQMDEAQARIPMMTEIPADDLTRNTKT